jgi:dTDP-4-amino-4,6-dideoxygalactose transaminase
VEYDERERCNYQYIVVEVDARITGIGRDQLLAVLAAENIDARRYFYPGCHRMEPYRSYIPNAHLLLKNTEQVLERTLALPTGTSVNVEQVRKICQLLNEAVHMGPAIVARLQRAANTHREDRHPCLIAL